MDTKIDRMFIGALRTNKGPNHIELPKDGNALMLPEPDATFCYELSLALQGLIRRKEKQLKQR